MPAIMVAEMASIVSGSSQYHMNRLIKPKDQYCNAELVLMDHKMIL
jgi:hypothetical protein